MAERVSDTRVVLIISRSELPVIFSKPDVPTLASLLRGSQAADSGHDVALTLKYLQSQTRRCVPGCQ